MDRSEIIERLEEIAKHAVHTAGEKPFVMSLDDGIALHEAIDILKQPERLSDDDFETIRIHLSAIKEKLCNQRRWKEAEEYQRLIDRFMAFASAQPEPCEDTTSRPFHNITMSEVLEYIDRMPEDVWQEFVSCLECRGWSLERKTAKWCGGDFA